MLARALFPEKTARFMKNPYKTAHISIRYCPFVAKRQHVLESKWRKKK